MPPAGKRKTKKEKEELAEAPNAPATDVEPIVLQLSIPPTRLDELMDMEQIPSVLEYNPTILDPQPYHPLDNFASENDTLTTAKEDNVTFHVNKTMKYLHTENASVSDHTTATCYWCCHHIDHMEFGMPIRYDVHHKSFTMFGCFCSLECVAAYNYSVHMGSDRVWEIHSWIQMLASRYGYEGNIRPAPSRYALQMFNGPMAIDEFRNAHKTLAKTYIMNIPPFIHVNSQIEVLNTSFLDTTDAGEKARAKKKVMVDKKAIETKLPCMTFGQT